ncbi:zinc finger BED domain-containing protein RICESLEEPER 2-like [Primulina huaijiensis]|uniref:zinc finger BED domain-containing protein RICESLEEPER 2-like n=1 Tax=Primulina huaijiensis TaxID=1492673 RepID=UPI003CC736AB
MIRLVRGSRLGSRKGFRPARIVGFSPSSGFEKILPNYIAQTWCYVLHEMETNDKEVVGAMQTAPTVESQASHSQNWSVSIGANETSQNENLDAEITGEDDGNKRKLRYPAWNHFERKKIGGKWRVVCNDCKKSLGAEEKNGTRHLLNHIKTCLYKRQKTINQSLLQQKKYNDEMVVLGTYNFNQDHGRTELANMIILHEYPLSMVDHVGFRRYSYALQPLFKVVSRNTIKNDIIKVFEYERDKTMKLLESNASRIALTIDMWKSSNYRLVRFMYVPCPHTVEILASALVECLLDWNLDSKLSTLTVDDCTTNDTMIEHILDKLPPSSLILEGKLFHMRCCAHILNLVVRDVLELICDSIKTIRYSVGFWSATPKRDEKFIETARQLKVLSTKQLELDCKTRWNSTYLMLITALEYKDVCARLKQRETLYKRVPKEEDWSKVREISSKYDNLVKTMATNMKVKFEKYWDVMNCLLAIGSGSILDPRYKMKTYQFYYPLVYGDMSSFEIKTVKKKLFDVVEEYKKNSKLSREKSELDYYLEESLLPRNTSDFDILCWWKTNGIKYPILHDIAKDVLAIPMTTVASKSTFSSSGRVLSTHRNKLHPKTVEALMCARNWLWIEIQDYIVSKDQKFDNDYDIEDPDEPEPRTNCKID